MSTKSVRKMSLRRVKLDQRLEHLLPQCGCEEDAALAAALRANGLVSPWLVDESFTLIDGYRTYRAAVAQGLSDALVTVVPGLSGEAKRHLRLSLNVNRRQLSRKQKKEIIRAEL